MADAFGATMAILIFLTFLVGGGVYYVTNLKNKQKALEEQNRNEEKSRNLVRLHTVIVSKITDIAELATVREDFTSEINFKKDAKEWNGFNLPLTGTEFRMTYTGVIVCGCDLMQFEVPIDSVTENSATIIIPRSKVLHIYPNVESYNIINLKADLFGKKLTLEEQNMLVAKDIETQQQRIINEGILKRADENVECILKAQMQSIGVTPRIIFLNNNETSRISASTNPRLLN